ncbi:Aspartate aminotransferase, cytoplasmic [Coelomomyces lativittatus]|nr:Aspartate aminotransferase, cytoplasmic [Coelomomyces lativittatus]
MYPYYDPKTCGLDFKGFLETIRSAAPQSIFLIHACAHNPTGVDPTQAQWKELFKALIECRHLVFFDCAYQGFATGDVDQDAWAVRTLANDTELLIAQSFAKNFGLYNERCGVLTVVTKTPAPVSSQLSQIQRAMISNPPAHGARIVSKILNSPDLYKEWLDCLKIMSQRIKDMRQKLYQSLCDMKTPGSWEHIINQIGMFCFTGLSEQQSRIMKTKFHIYMTINGRISMAGLNNQNIDYFAKSMDWVVRNVSPTDSKL